MSWPLPLRPCSVGPHPVADLRWILQMLMGIRHRLLDPCLTVSDQPWRARAQARHATNRLRCQVEAAHCVEDNHLERRGGGALLVEAAHVDPIDIRVPMHDLVNRPLVAVERKDYWLV